MTESYSLFLALKKKSLFFKQILTNIKIDFVMPCLANNKSLPMNFQVKANTTLLIGNINA
jgi:hypothetical protein